MGVLNRSRPKADRTERRINPYLAGVLREFRPTLMSVFAFSFVINLLTLAVPLYLLQIYARVLPNRSLDTLLFLSCIVLIAVLVQGILDAFRRSILARVGVGFEHKVSEHLLDSALQRALVLPDTNASVLRDLGSLRRFVSGSAVFPLLDLPWTPLFLFCLYLLHPILGALGLAGVLIMFAVACLNEVLSREPVNRAEADSRRGLDTADHVIRNAEAVQAMGMQTSMLRRWRTRNEHTLLASFEASRITARLAALSKVVRLALQIGIIAAAAWLILTQSLTAGITIASVLLLRRAIAPIEQSIRSWKGFIAARASFRNVSEYLDHANSLEISPDMPVPRPPLVASGLSYKPRGAKDPIFRRVDLQIDAGQILALTGSTASGKSTLLRLLAGVAAPRSGAITLDGIALDHWSADQRGPHIGFLPQDVQLFEGTVRDNIARFGEAEIEEVIAAATSARVHDMICELPEGYHTELGSDGHNLSGGQRQRIGLARALFGSPSLLLLDEPDANLDSHGRSALRKTLRMLRRNGAALIIVTHHASTREVADRIMELENGRLRLLRDKSTSAKRGTGAHSAEQEPALRRVTHAIGLNTDLPATDVPSGDTSAASSMSSTAVPDRTRPAPDVARNLPLPVTTSTPREGMHSAATRCLSRKRRRHGAGFDRAAPPRPASSLESDDGG